MEFPEYSGGDYNKYFLNKKDNIETSGIPGLPVENRNEDPFYYFEHLKIILKEENFQHKYRRLVSFLLKMNENIIQANKYIDLKELEKLNEIINILKDGYFTLKDTITGGRLKDERLMEFTLGTIEDINKTILREEDLKKGNDISKFISHFEINNTIPRNTNNLEELYQK